MKANEGNVIILGGTRVAYGVRRSQRAKRIRMTIEENGDLVVTLPSRGRLKDIPPVLRAHQSWILRKIEESQNKKRIAPPFELKNGAKLPVLDRYYRLILQATKGKRAHWYFEANQLFISASTFDSTLVYRGVESWYRKMAGFFLEDRVPYWAEQLGVTPKCIRVKNQRSLWGSCSKKANLNFNWRILLLSPETADYLIIHELAHLKELNHSGKFWDIVQTFCPDYKFHKAELRKKDSWLRFPPTE